MVFLYAEMVDDEDINFTFIHLCHHEMLLLVSYTSNYELIIEKHALLSLI